MPSELRPSQALRLWHDVILDLVRDDEPDLSARQQAVLMTVYLEPPPHTVRGLAAELAISKPAVTRALDALGRLGFIRRDPDERDRRSIVIERTVKGSVFLSEFADQIARAARDLEA